MSPTTATYVCCSIFCLLLNKDKYFLEIHLSYIWKSVATVAIILCVIISSKIKVWHYLSLFVPNFAAKSKKNMTTTKLSLPAKSRSTAACPSIRTAARPSAAALCSVSSSLGLVMMKYLAAEHAHTRHARNRVPGCCDSTRSVKLPTKLSFSWKQAKVLKQTA